MNKVWLVTGSASGLGRNIAEAVLESGDLLVATARDTKRLDDLVKKYGDRVRAVPFDVTDESAAQAAVQTAVAAFGRLDVVVNNAGYGDIAPFEQLSAERFKAVMDTNFYGVGNVTRAAVPLMREQRSGCILQISSVGGRLTGPGSTPYHAAKWAVGGFTESLAQELSPFGVKVCALEPGGMRGGTVAGREPFDRHGVCHGITGHALLRAAASRRRVNGVMISPAPRSRG